jgi:hypothetical protein
MRRLLLLLTAAIFVVTMLAVAAVPALATIHPLSRAEMSAGHAPDFTPATTQDPRGLSRPGSQNFAQPVSSVLPAGTCLTPQETGEAQTICGTNPSPNGTAVTNAFEANP